MARKIETPPPSATPPVEEPAEIESGFAHASETAEGGSFVPY